MKVEVGSITVTSSGNKTYFFDDMSFKAKGMMFFVSGNVTSNTDMSIGLSDSIRHRALGEYSNGSNHQSKRDTSKSIVHYTTGSSITKTLSGKVQASGLDSTGMFKLEFDTCTRPHSIDFIAFGE